MTRIAVFLLLSAPLLSQQPFAARCAACHGEDARGTAQGPGLAMNPRVAAQSPEQLRAYLQHGNPGAGMPSFADLPAAELASLAQYLRRINNDTILMPVTPTAPARKITFGAPQPGDWPTYNGNLSANRYSPLKQINRANVSSLKLKWVFPIPYFGLEVTPIAADGVLYVTGPNQVFALDALTGDPLWQYSRPRSAGLVGDARLGTNRVSPFCSTRSSSLPTTPTCWRWTAAPGNCSGRPRWRQCRPSAIPMAAPSRRSSSATW